MTMVNTSTYVDKIKLWPGLYKTQPNSISLDKQLDYMNNTFEMKAGPQLNDMYINIIGALALVENQYISTTP